VAFRHDCPTHALLRRKNNRLPLLGSVSGELGLRKYLASNGHTYVATSSKDGADSVLDKELEDAEIVISQPFWPTYMTAERIKRAKNLKMIVTAAIGSDHTDVHAANCVTAMRLLSTA